MRGASLANAVLFLVPSLIWGSTWYVITFQLGTIDPVVSVCYRFAIAGLVMLIVCRTVGLSLKFSTREHLLIALQGACLFSLNYWMVYVAEISLMSGLVAVVFSLIIFFNIFLSSVFLKIRIEPRVLVGAVLGVGGTAVIFRSELATFALSKANLVALAVCTLAVVLASLGNILSAHNQRRGIPVIQSNALGMTYGSILMLILAVASGKELTIDTNPPYLLSLAYLSVFGSIVAFGAYLKLLGTIGPDKAAYTILVIPIIALLVSSLFEGFAWTGSALVGVVLILAGNALALAKRRGARRALLHDQREPA